MSTEKVEWGGIKRHTLLTAWRICVWSGLGNLWDDVMGQITEESDGTFTVGPDFFFDLFEPLKGIPSRALAKQIVEALYKAERAGGAHYAESV